MIDDEVINAVVHAYGLRAHPYARRELDPVKDAEDLELFCMVDGWQEAANVGGFVQQRARTRDPALVVIAGGSGTGRTSLANYLVREWADARADAQDVNFDRARLVVSRSSVTNYRSDEQLWDWVLGLEPLVLKRRIPLSATTSDAFRDLGNSMPQALGRGLQRVLIGLTDELHAAGAALAGILEGVRTQELVTLAGEAFSLVDALVVLTIDDTVGNFDAVLSTLRGDLDPESARLVTLSDLQPLDATAVVRHRWDTCSDHPPPFQDAGLTAAFSGRARPLARILATLEALLMLKEIDFRGHGQWPHLRELEFSDDELRRKIRSIENLIAPRR
jgi:hypothetical protein